MRTAFINKLIDLAKSDESIFLIVGDLGYSVVEPFANEFPNRFINAGVAEQNMTGMAAGLANEGFKVFTYSIGNFPTLRALEQVRYDICYNKLNVNIVSVGAGYAYGSLGVSHHSTEDIGIMRSLPNMRVFSPGDPIETKLITEFVVSNPGPSYLRLGKAGESIIHTYNNVFPINKIIQIISNKNSKTAVIATGSILSYANEIIKKNEKLLDLFSCPMIKPLDSDSLKLISEKYENVVTIEEHQKSAGFGSAIIEELTDLKFYNKITKIPNIKRIAIKDEFLVVGGSQEYLRSMAGLEF